MPARLLTLALALSWALPAAALRPVPALTGPVVDEAGIVDAGSRATLEGLARRARAEGGVQLQVLTVRSLEGEEVAAFSMRVAEAWRLGTRGKDDGVLLLVAIEDRKVRIEVGGGLEGALTDAQSGRIIRSTIAPAFRERRYGPGLVAASRQILGALGVEAGGAVDGRPPSGPAYTSGWHLLGSMLPFLLFIGVPILIIAISVAARSGRGGRGGFGGWGGPFLGGGWGGGGGFGGGSFGGGGGGGGWSGGGGGFSGGGASGSW